MTNDQHAVIFGLGGMFLSYGLGWLVFYLLTKQVNPFKKPKEIQDRPKWFLSLGFGFLIGVMFASPTIAGEDLLGTVIVKIALLIMWMIPVLIGYFLYKIKIRRATKNP